MSRTNSQAKIVSKEQLVSLSNRLVIKKNNQRVTSDSHITATMLRFVVEILRKTRSLTIVEEAFVGELANFISIQEQRSQQCQRSQLTIDRHTDQVVADMYNEWGQKIKGEGSSVSQNIYYSSSDNDNDATLYSSSSEKPEGSANEIDDADKSDMDLSDDNPDRNDDDERYGVFMHNKSTAIPNSTYLGLTVTSSSLDFIQTLLDETPVNELMDFISHPVYTDAHTTLVVHNPEGNPELTSYILGASKVPLGTHVDVLATKTLMQELFPDNNAHHIPSLPVKKILYPTTTPQPNSLQAKAKKPMQKAKKNMRKFSFKKAVAQKFKEYDQKPKALKNFNVFEAFEKAGENKKKRQKDVGEPSSRSSRQNRSPVIRVQDETPAMQPLDPVDILIQKHSNSESFLKKSGLAKRRTTWFDLFLKSDIDKDENHILGPSTIAIVKKFKELIQKDELTIADFAGRGLERLKMQYNNDVELKYHNNDYTYLVDLSTEEKYSTSITKHYAARYYKEGIEDRIPERWSKEVCHCHFEALNGRRSDDKKYKFSYADLPRLSVNDVEDMYLLHVQDKLHHLPLEFVKDFNNALFMFIKRTMIKNKVEDIQLGVESY
ncbi:hypothetical protein Tco_0312617 [Tanacetum coccineum]